jgi:hypothetical protein
MGIQRLQPISGGTDWSKLTPMIQTVNSQNNIGGNSYYDEIIINGKGIITQITIFLNSAYLAPSIIIDGGTEKQLYVNQSSNAILPLIAGNNMFSQNTSIYNEILSINSPIPFNSSFVIRMRNLSGSARADLRTYQIVYHV